MIVNSILFIRANKISKNKKIKYICILVNFLSNENAAKIKENSNENKIVDCSPCKK